VHLTSDCAQVLRGAGAIEADEDREWICVDGKSTVASSARVITTTSPLWKSIGLVNDCADNFDGRGGVANKWIRRRRGQPAVRFAAGDSIIALVNELKK